MPTAKKTDDAKPQATKAAEPDAASGNTAKHTVTGEENQPATTAERAAEDGQAAKQRDAAGAFDPSKDRDRETRPEDGNPLKTQLAPNDPHETGHDKRDQVTPSVVVDEPQTVVNPARSRPAGASADANGEGVDINVTPDGEADRVPPVTVDGKPLPVDHRGVPITDQGTLEPDASNDAGHEANSGNDDAKLADELDDHAAGLTNGDHRVAAALRKAAGRLRNR